MVKGEINQSEAEDRAGEMPYLAESVDDLAREVYGFLGVPLDAIDIPSIIRRIAAATRQRSPYLISTANVNFLITARRNTRFRDSLLMSDVCTADGMPVVWMARLSGLPVRDRVTGADLFRALRSVAVRVFLFGGEGDAAETVCRDINLQPSGMRCAGALNPGFGEIEALSREEIIVRINESNADFLGVFLNARKAQEWLLYNHKRLRPPVRAQFGATINFEAGLVRRAPRFVRALGFEWLWRVKEEPYLWRRYLNDGVSLASMFLASVIPMWIHGRLAKRGSPSDLKISFVQGAEATVLLLKGDAIGQFVERAAAVMRLALIHDRSLTIDLSEVKSLDYRFLGLILMLRKQLMSRDLVLRWRSVPTNIERWLTLNRFEFLLAA